MTPYCDIRGKEFFISLVITAYGYIYFCHGQPCFVLVSKSG